MKLYFVDLDVMCINNFWSVFFLQCWSDGSVSFIPLLFSPSSSVGSFQNGALKSQ